MEVTIVVDCMGGDHGPSVTLPAAFNYLSRDRDCRVVLVGKPEALEPVFATAVSAGNASSLAALYAALPSHARERVTVRFASEVVEMTDAPAQAMRSKKDSSMRVAVDLVKEGAAQAAVSAGNTGALMAISRFVLKTLPGIDRPAICSVLPSQRGRSYVLDLGANVDCDATHLLQFGIMGAMLASALEQVDQPSVGLLNIGEEDIKGNEVVKQAAELLRNSGLNFYGNVEGNDIYRGTTDIVVCDGFVGNVTLKASEGLAQMLGGFLREEFSRSWMTRAMAICALPALKAFKRRVDHRAYNGACLLGLRGVVVKSHGSADVFAFEQAIHRAAEAARNQLVERITERMAHLQPAPEVVQ